MKKLFLLLLFPVIAFGQDFHIKHEVLETGPFEVGDTITVKYTLIDNTAGTPLKFLQFDVGADQRKLLRLGTPNWLVTTPANKTVIHNYWNNYNYIPTAGVEENNLPGQYTGGLDYQGGGNSGINRYSIQSTDGINGEILLQQFTIQDISTSGLPDYSDAIKFNWARVQDANNSYSFTMAPLPTLSLGLDQVGDVPAGTVTFQLQTPNVNNGTDYIIVLEPYELYMAYNSQDPSSVDYSQYPPQVQGNLDISGKFVTTELLQDVEYIVNVFIESSYDQESQESTYPQWLDDVVTVSDVMQAFKQAIGTNPDGSGNHFQYNIQKELANVVRQGPNDPVDFDDSYTLLAHITGVLQNSAGSNQPPAEGEEFYPITSFNNGAMNWSGFFDTFGKPMNSEEEWLATRKFILTDDQPVTFNMAHGLMGDADLSHSTTPNLNDDTKIPAAVAKSRNNTNIMRAVAQETIDLDIVSQLVDGKVVMEVNLTKQDLAGMQFNISYDKSILTFEDVTFDTGNTGTNFAKHFEDGRINFGSINLNSENIKTGKPFKLVFTPKVSIQNTSGLISFRVTDAVKNNGTKVNLNLR